MSFLPDIDEDGKLKEEPKAKRLYTPPMTTNPKIEEARLSELNNWGRKEVTEDFSDSPFLNS